MTYDIVCVCGHFNSHAMRCAYYIHTRTRMASIEQLKCRSRASCDWRNFYELISKIRPHALRVVLCPPLFYILHLLLDL